VRCGGLIGLRSNIELRVDEIHCPVAAVPEELAAAYRRSLKRSVCQMVYWRLWCD
jgi:hypothetical protein